MNKLQQKALEEYNQPYDSLKILQKKRLRDELFNDDKN